MTGQRTGSPNHTSRTVSPLPGVPAAVPPSGAASGASADAPPAVPSPPRPGIGAAVPRRAVAASGSGAGPSCLIAAAAAGSGSAPSARAPPAADAAPLASDPASAAPAWKSTRGIRPVAVTRTFTICTGSSGFSWP